MKSLVISLLFAVLNILVFLFNDSVLGYFNLIVGCLCFICAGMDLKRIMDEKLDDMKNK